MRGQSEAYKLSATGENLLKGKWTDQLIHSDDAEFMLNLDLKPDFCFKIKFLKMKNFSFLKIGRRNSSVVNFLPKPTKTSGKDEKVGLFNKSGYESDITLFNLTTWGKSIYFSSLILINRFFFLEVRKWKCKRNIKAHFPVLFNLLRWQKIFVWNRNYSYFYTRLRCCCCITMLLLL